MKPSVPVFNREVFGFAFKPNFTSGLLCKIKNIDTCYLVHGQKSIDGYTGWLYQVQPKYILGLGMYTGRDQGKIRIETVCTNSFRNYPIESIAAQRIEIEPFLEPLKNSKYSKGMGNSYCNYASWQIMREIQKSALNTRYTFLHIPREMNRSIALNEIELMLINLKRPR